jgi:hypothetical protein
LSVFWSDASQNEAMAKPAMDGRTVTVSHRAQRRSSSMQNAEAEAEPPQSQNF